MTVRISAARYDDIARTLGYRFSDKALLRHALTHASTRRKIHDYERLEFLGDRVLGLVIAEHLFRLFPNQREGQLSARHSQLVRGDSCAAVGRVLGIERFIIMGESERAKGLNLQTSVLGDVVEALIGGIYLDGGLEAARSFILPNWQMAAITDTGFQKDAKTFLQEWALSRELPIPVYRVIHREGPEHAPLFVVEVAVDGRKPMQGQGRSKRLAEQDAAEQLLRRDGIRT